MLLKGDIQSRKWLIKFTRPTDKGYTHSWIKNQLSSFKSLRYWCMADEVGGQEKFPRVNLYIVLSSAVRLSTIERRFGSVEAKVAHGTSEQNWAYVFKEGEWQNDKTRGLVLRNTCEERGTRPKERQGARTDIMRFR